MKSADRSCPFGRPKHHNIRGITFSHEQIGTVRSSTEGLEETLAPVKGCEEVDIETGRFNVIETLCPSSSSSLTVVKSFRTEGQSFSLAPGGCGR
jgi:hypothetical protein